MTKKIEHTWNMRPLQDGLFRVEQERRSALSAQGEVGRLSWT